MDNKRQQKRFAKCYPTEIVSNNITFKGLSSDFSLNGLFLISNHPFAPGMIINLSIHFSDDLSSKVKGKVVRFKRTQRGRTKERYRNPGKNGIGIEIIKKDANYLHLIRSLLK